MAFLIGWLVGRRVRRGHTGIAPLQTQTRISFADRLRQGMRHGLVELVDHVGPWLLAGLAIAALVEPLLSADWLKELPWGADVVIFTILGMPAYVCASGATPLAAVLIAGGVSPGAAIAFLLSGPGTNVTTFGVLSKLHGRAIAVAFGATMLILGVGTGIAINLLVERGKLVVPAITEHSATPLQIVSLVFLSMIFAASILRQGPRGFVGQVLSPYETGAGDGHDHGHEHEHDHGHKHDDCC
jgi:hypothetical protein